jgi:hypothetical protein
LIRSWRGFPTCVTGSTQLGEQKVAPIVMIRATFID